MTCSLQPAINPLLGIKFFEKRVATLLNSTISAEEEKSGLDAFFRGIGPDLRLGTNPGPHPRRVGYGASGDFVIPPGTPRVKVRDD